MQQVANDRMREIRMWSDMLEELDDGTFDTENVNTHQLVSYGLRFKEQMKNTGNASPSEMSNLVGQYDSAMKHLRKEGLLVEDKRSIVDPSYPQPLSIG
jgi:hypothetical protein